MSEVVRCQGLTKKYGGLIALNSVDLSIESGKIIGLLGPNGSGKTTLIKIINGLLTPTSGTVTIDGDLPGIATKAKISYLPDNNYLNSWMTVGQIVDMFRDFYDDFRPQLAYEMLAKLADKELVRGAADAGLYFLRVGADAGDGAGSVKAVAAVKEAGLTCRYSLMKGYVLPAAELAKEAKLLQGAGVDRITIMDSAGTMFPDQTTEYVKALKDSVTIPVGFHGHSNLGLSQANALAAVAAGADEIDCGLLGMARSAGNCATELAAATLKREGYLPAVDLFGLLHYLEDDLIPTMKPYHYHVAIAPVELMLGLSGCHSSFLPMFRKVAHEEGVSLLKLIAEASTIDRKAPSESLLRDVAKKLK